MLVIIYPTSVSLLVFLGWVRKQRVLRKDPGGTSAVHIDEDTDRLKNRFFIISIVITFFVIAPFLALLMML